MTYEEYPINVRIYADGMTKDYKQSWLSSILAVVSLFLYTGWLHIMLILIAFSWIRSVLMLVILIFSTLLLPAAPVLWPAFNQLSIFITWRQYFHFSYLFEERFDSKKKYVFVEFPHGVFPMGPIVAATLVQSIFPDFSIYSLAANTVFYIPFWRHFVSWIGSMPATSKNFKMLLKSGSVAVIVGGIAEMFMQHPKQEQVLLKNRKGFVKIAVEAGCDGLVPVYHFGNSQLLDFYPQSLSPLSRQLQTALGFLYGRCGLPLPRRHPVYMVMGKPITVTKLSKDDPEFPNVVDALHAQVMDELQKMYDNHKAEFGWKDRPLVIM